MHCTACSLAGEPQRLALRSLKFSTAGTNSDSVRPGQSHRFIVTVLILSTFDHIAPSIHSTMLSPLHPFTPQPCVPGDRQKSTSWNGNGHVTAAAVHTCLCLNLFFLTFPPHSTPTHLDLWREHLKGRVNWRELEEETTGKCDSNLEMSVRLCRPTTPQIINH